jgi:hypothetical protein
VDVCLLLNVNRPVPLPLLACYLPGGGVEAVPEVGGGDVEDQGSESLLVVVLGSLIDHSKFCILVLWGQPQRNGGKRAFQVKLVWC